MKEKGMRGQNSYRQKIQCIEIFFVSKVQMRKEIIVEGVKISLAEDS